MLGSALRKHRVPTMGTGRQLAAALQRKPAGFCASAKQSIRSAGTLSAKRRLIAGVRAFGSSSGHCSSSPTGTPSAKKRRFVSAQALGSSLASRCAWASGEVDNDAGLVTESDYEHRRRHPIPVKSCRRCVYLTYRKRWEQHYGSHRHEIQGHNARTIWLAPRPARLGGVWALGCVFCAHYAQRRCDLKNGEEPPVNKKRKRGPQDGNTKWARYEVTKLTQIAMRGIVQHAHTSMHRKATWLHFMPDIVEM